MRIRTWWTLLGVPILAIAWAGGDKGGGAVEEPRYDTATVVDIHVVVAEMRETPKGNPLAGVHMMARLESARENSELIDIYIGPTDFVNDLGFPFKAHERMEVAGSKVKFGAGSVILAREVRHYNDYLYIRDQKGEPVWKQIPKGA